MTGHTGIPGAPTSQSSHLVNTGFSERPYFKKWGGEWLRTPMLTSSLHMYVQPQANSKNGHCHPGTVPHLHHAPSQLEHYFWARSSPWAMMHFPMLLCNKHYCFFIVGISFSPNLLALVLETPDPIPEPHNGGKRSWQLRPLARCVRPLKQPRPLCLFVVFGKNERREHVRLFKAVSGVGKAFLVEGWLWTVWDTRSSEWDRAARKRAGV